MDDGYFLGTFFFTLSRRFFCQHDGSFLATDKQTLLPTISGIIERGWVNGWAEGWTVTRVILLPLSSRRVQNKTLRGFSNEYLEYKPPSGPAQTTTNRFSHVLETRS